MYVRRDEPLPMILMVLYRYQCWQSQLQINVPEVPLLNWGRSGWLIPMGILTAEAEFHADHVDKYLQNGMSK